MDLFHHTKDASVSIASTVRLFKETAGLYLNKGDIEGINQLYSHLYTELLLGLRDQPLEQMRARLEMGQALHQIFTLPGQARRRYFETYRSARWRQET